MHKLSYKISAIQQELTNTYEYISKYDALLYLADLYPCTPLHIKVQAYNSIDW